MLFGRECLKGREGAVRWPAWKHVVKILGLAGLRSCTPPPVSGNSDLSYNRMPDYKEHFEGHLVRAGACIRCANPLREHEIGSTRSVVFQLWHPIVLYRCRPAWFFLNCTTFLSRVEREIHCESVFCYWPVTFQNYFCTYLYVVTFLIFMIWSINM